MKTLNVEEKKQVAEAKLAERLAKEQQRKEEQKQKEQKKEEKKRIKEQKQLEISERKAKRLKFISESLMMLRDFTKTKDFLRNIAREEEFYDQEEASQLYENPGYEASHISLSQNNYSNISESSQYILQQNTIEFKNKSSIHNDFYTQNDYNIFITKNFINSSEKILEENKEQCIKENNAELERKNEICNLIFDDRETYDEQRYQEYQNMLKEIGEAL